MPPRPRISTGVYTGTGGRITTPPRAVTWFIAVTDSTGGGAVYVTDCSTMVLRRDPGRQWRACPMIPIHELISRIRWDSDFGAADFQVGYYDRMRNRVVRVPFRALYFEPSDHFAFRLLDANGELQTIPFHRVREVWRNGVLIWRRGGGGLASR